MTVDINIGFDVFVEVEIFVKLYVRVVIAQVKTADDAGGFRNEFDMVQVRDNHGFVPSKKRGVIAVTL